ncbi:hypothetical protein BDZ89DRAFT_1075271 [Hymenopellis radicata]|nr:hypothetical protein BDZ89DRAFT_1075271 [Hymenopellis radicata]
MDSPAADQEKGYGSSSDDGHGPAIYEQHKGLKGLYYNPITQVSMLGFVCFMGPGLFNALNGLGAGGQVDSETNSNANTALYATFAAMAFFAGSVNNMLGPKLTLLGSMGYCLYIGSYLAMNIHPNAGGFVVAAGAILGICAGLLWTAQGCLMMSYPTESQKGKFIAIFWSIFNLGGVVGAAVACGRNWHSTAGNVDNGTYIGFLILTLIGVSIPMAMADPDKMNSLGRYQDRIMGLWITLRTDPMILLLFPCSSPRTGSTRGSKPCLKHFAEFSGFQRCFFTIRARSKQSLSTGSLPIGSVLIGLLLDRQSISRRLRAYSGWTVLFLMKQYTRATADHSIDIYDKQYVGRVFFYIFCGLLDAMWQTTSYWLMGAMSNDPSKLAFFAGFYKSIQSSGGAGIWRADAVGIPYMNMFISTWALLAGSYEAIARMDETGHVMTTEVAKERGVAA